MADRISKAWADHVASLTWGDEDVGIKVTLHTGSPLTPPVAAELNANDVTWTRASGTLIWPPPDDEVAPA